MGVLVVLRRATFTLFYPSPVEAIRPLLSVYSIRGALREHCAAVLTFQCELGNSTLMPCGFWSFDFAALLHLGTLLFSGILIASLPVVSMC